MTFSFPKDLIQSPKFYHNSPIIWDHEYVNYRVWLIVAFQREFLVKILGCIHLLDLLKEYKNNLQHLLDEKEIILSVHASIASI